jgi:hypothetical protein
MTRRAYLTKEFGPKRALMISQANSIIADYTAAGYTLTLRQLYYQFVARDLLPNTTRSYDILGAVINEGRLAGLVDWEAIEDRTRNMVRRTTWDSPQEIIAACASSYHNAWWEGQDRYVEVWVEKEALAGVVERPARRMDVPWFCCRGYVSQSEMWSAAQRMQHRYHIKHQRPVIIHLGDHDPSGIDMSRDIQDRMDLFCGPGVVDVERIALNMDQVQQYAPPPNPAKVTDSRAKDYIAQFGGSSWELDALEPRIMEDLITTTIQRYCDMDLFTARQEQEDNDKAVLTLVSQQWDAVVDFVTGREEPDA